MNTTTDTTINSERRHSVEGLRSAFERIADGTEESAKVLTVAIEKDVSLFEACDIIRSASDPRACKCGEGPLAGIDGAEFGHFTTDQGTYCQRCGRKQRA